MVRHEKQSIQILQVNRDTPVFFMVLVVLVVPMMLVLSLFLFLTTPSSIIITS